MTKVSTSIVLFQKGGRTISDILLFVSPVLCVLVGGVVADGEAFNTGPNAADGSGEPGGVVLKPSLAVLLFDREDLPFRAFRTLSRSVLVSFKNSRIGAFQEAILL